MKVKDRWASKIGVILAVAGSAVGLGNFLRFPGVVAQNGGGTFLIPYFVAFVLLGIPMMWVEWSVGRLGGSHGHSTLPAMYQHLTNKKWGKYLGIFGLLLPFIVFCYYLYIASWTLAYSWFAITGELSALDKSNCGSFFGNFISFEGIFTPLVLFFILTFIINYLILRKGISGGIEKVCKVALPLLFFMALIIMIRVITLDGISEGFGFVWNPDFSELFNVRMWLAATGQIFFTLSLGFGVIQTYASYLKKNDDIALSGLTSSSLDTFAAVVLGGSIAIPAAVLFLGVAQAQEIAQGSIFSIAFVIMPVIFNNMGNFAPFYGFLWFGLLFIAGVTSSISLAQPLIAFLQDEFRFSREKSVATIFILVLIMAIPTIFYMNNGFVDELDFWAGNFFIVVSATIQIILFSWVFGINKGWKEINHASQIKIPAIFKFVLKYITPAYLITLLIIWIYEHAIGQLLMKEIDEANVGATLLARGILVLVAAVLLFLVSKAYKDFKAIENREGNL
ncbi:MAG: sodium-dependent transporter [Candidatus Muiribacteriota bacterium]